MHSSKIYVRFSTILICLLVLSIGAIIQATTPETITKKVEYSDDYYTSSAQEKTIYNLKRQELQLAVQKYFKKAIASGTIVGAGVSIVRNDSILLNDGFGRRNFNLDKKVDGETIFRLGSLSKGFTGVLASKIKNEGKLDWDDKVSDFIPGFQLGNQANSDNITLGTILSHTSGTPYHSYTNLVEAGLPLTDIAKRFKNVTPISTPGEMYSYQNAMFALSSEMMYKATGEDIATSLENNFFKPLEMCSTNMSHESLIKNKNVALPHAPRKNGWRTLKLRNSYYNAIAAGGINSSATDMAKWMQFLLGYHPEVMKESAIQEVFQPVIEIKGHNKYYHRWPGHLTSYYAYGWRIHKYSEENSKEEKTIWHHGGSVNNFRNEIALFPEDNLGICVLFNSANKVSRTVIPDLQKIIREIYNTSIEDLSLEKSDHASLLETEN